MEVLGGLVIAEQVISTTIEVGALAGIAVARPTNKLKAKFTCIANTPSGSPDSMARAHHTATLVGGDLYIFGGLVSLNPPQLAGDEMHILRLSNLDGLGPNYKAVPALGSESGLTPVARAGHSATAIDGKIYLFGGRVYDRSSDVLNENGRVWVFDPETFHWSFAEPLNLTFPQLSSHTTIAYKDNLIVHGGYHTTSSVASNETWHFDIASRIWTQLPSFNDHPGSSPMIAVAPPSIACVGDKLYLITGCSALESQIHVLYLAGGSSSQDSTWKTISFPTNPLTPGPRPRQGASLVPVTTAPGRNYLLLLLGAKTAQSASSSEESKEILTEVSSDEGGTEARFWSEIWSLQVPADFPAPAALKDATRSGLGMNTGEAQWAEVEVLPPSPADLPTEDGAQGKLHPGPRGYFACDRVDDRSVVLWGGEDAQGACLGDGWLVEIKV